MNQNKPFQKAWGGQYVAAILQGAGFHPKFVLQNPVLCENAPGKKCKVCPKTQINLYEEYFLQWFLLNHKHTS